MVDNTSNSDCLSSKHKFGISLEKILQYNLDFSNNSLEKERTVANYVDYIGEKRYESGYEHMIRDRIKKKYSDSNQIPIYEKYGSLVQDDESKEFNKNNVGLISNETNFSFADNITHRTVIIELILDSIKNNNDKNINGAIEKCFQNLKNDEMYFQQFFNQLQALILFVRNCASAKNAFYEQQNKEKEQKTQVFDTIVLNPIDVICVLPKDLKDCLLGRDIIQLNKVLFEISKQEEGAYYIDLCLKSGLLIHASKNEEDNNK